MWKPDWLKGPEETAKKDVIYEITSVEDFNAAAFIVKDKDNKSVNIVDLALEVGDKLQCIGRGGGGHPQFRYGDYIISTSFKADGRPDSYGLKPATM